MHLLFRAVVGTPSDFGPCGFLQKLHKLHGVIYDDEKRTNKLQNLSQIYNKPTRAVTEAVAIDFRLVVSFFAISPLQ